MNEDCPDEAFIVSYPFQDKVFLHPWKTSDRRGDWFNNRAYCARHCAEMVTIHSEEEQKFFFDFMRSVGMTHPGAWLGAQIDDRKDFRRWYNGVEASHYIPVAPGEYNEGGLTCLDIGWDESVAFWRNYYCTGAVSNIHFVACQRASSSSTTTSIVAGSTRLTTVKISIDGNVFIHMI